MEASIKIYKSTHKNKDYIRNKLVDYNRIQVPFTQGKLDVQPLNFHIRNEDGEVIAGINACMYCWNVVFVDILLVDVNYRKHGLGSKLLNHVEAKAKSSGAYLIHLDTFDFQAKDFYLKQRYEIYGVLEDCPKGHKRYYLKKTLA